MTVTNHSKNSCSFQPVQIQREQWRDIVGFEGLYKISSFGRVLSLSVDAPYQRRQKILKPCNARGYKLARIYKNRQQHDFYIHRLVCRAFIGESDLQVNHKNGIKSDNNIFNLEYVTQTENMRHRIDVLGIKQRTPIIPSERRARGKNHWSKRHPEKIPRGCQRKQAKLTESEVKQIRELYAAKQGSQDALARKFGVHQHTVWGIVNYKQWKHI